MAKEKIKYGQIGVGHAHASKMSVYRQSDDFEVVGVVEPNAELRKTRGSHPTYKGLKWMTQEELLNTPGLQVVGVETEVKHLLDVAETSIKAGMHIHLDKPAGSNLPQFKRILDEAARKHLLVQMGYMYRYNPAVVMMREFLQKGWLGDPFEVHTVMSKVVGASSRRGLAEYPGGMIFELGCHIIDLVIGVLGRPTEVHSFRQHVSPIDDGLVDNMLATLVYPKSIATVKSSAQEVEGFSRRHFVVCGSEGTFHIEPLDAPNVRFALSKDRGDFKRGYQTKKIGNYARYVADAADMAKIIRGEKDSDFSYEHDYRVQETVLKASGLPLD
ncbi:MAG: dehydrogenase [Planctomycetaceae bacterium]|nr:dehydrogenase [Planctomycetaceae bacterium]